MPFGLRGGTIALTKVDVSELEFRVLRHITLDKEKQDED